MRESNKKMTAVAVHHAGGFHLPPGYWLEADADILVMYRQDGSVVARFSARHATPSEVTRTAEKDYRISGS